MAIFSRILRSTTGFVLGLSLASGGAFAATLTGQVVCSQCWFESDRSVTAYGTDEDLECAGRCAAQGVDAALAIREDGAFKLYVLQGPPPDGGAWLAWAGRFVRAEGAVDAGKGPPRFRADSVQRLAASPWPQLPVAASQRGGDDEAAPQAALAWTDLRGNPVSTDDFRGRIVVVNFWATWCLPCKKEMPDLIELHDRFAPYRVEFVGATADGADQAEGVLAFVRKQKINFPIVLGATTRQMELLGLPPALPATVVLDEHGHAVDWFPGVIDPAAVDAALVNLLGLADPGAAGKPVRVAGIRADTHGKQSHASLVPS